jgi:hypothetical protein
MIFCPANTGFFFFKHHSRDFEIVQSAMDWIKKKIRFVTYEFFGYTILQIMDFSKN